MARAYIVLARNDLDDSLLQVLDLKPHPTPSQGSRVYQPQSQGGYQTHYLIDGVNANVATLGVGPITVDGDTYGLSAYLIDHVEGLGVPPALMALTAAEAILAAAAIEAEVAAGNPLALRDIGDAMGGALAVSNTAQAGAATTITIAVANNQADDYYNGWTILTTGGTGAGQSRTVLDYVNATNVTTVAAWGVNPDATTTYTLTPPIGLTAGNSTGSVEEVLRILGGERWKLPTGSVVEDAGNLFEATVSGFFVTRPNVEVPDSVRTTFGVDRPLRGRSHTAPNAYIRPGEPRIAPVQMGTEDTNFNDVRQNVDTGDLQLSAINGKLSELISATFMFQNPAFSYGAGGTALDISGTVIPTTFQGRAVVVYDATGGVI